jgi:hypothetical protein
MGGTSSNPDGLPITGLPDDGGLLKLGDEIIAYEELDTATGALRGVRRGVLGTEAGIHTFDDRVMEMEGVTMAVLASGVSSTSYEIELSRLDEFPRSGGACVKIGDEIIGYTHARGTSLTMPRETGFFDDAGGNDFGTDSEGGGIFRGRYGTVASSHESGEIVYFLPTRFPDRYRERSQNPETSAVVFSRKIDGAIFKRVSWDERLAEYTDVKVLVRFDNSPPWDSENIYSVKEGRPVSGRLEDFATNPKSFLFQIDDPHEINRLDLQADLIEIRFACQFEAGAYDLTKDPNGNSWKDSPWIKALRIEYVAPETVHYTEESR